jgi:hypothetical protein
MKKIFRTIAALLVTLSVFLLTSCPDANGLHNQTGSKVTFVFTGFPESVNGDYAIPGDFNGDSTWENEVKNVDVTMKNGEGTSTTQFMVTSSWIKFSLVPTGDVSWNRPWYDEVTGNVEDTGTAGSPMQNFFIEGYELGSGDFTITVDCSSGSAVLYAE